MKRILVVFLALTISLLSCACENATSSQTTGNDIQVTEAKKDDIIEFDHLILADDVNVRIELVNFYAEDVNWSTGAQNEKIVTFQFQNKTDHNILWSNGNFYLNNERTFVMFNSGTTSLEAGRSGKASMIIAEDTQPEHTALKSLDELYDLEGTFSIFHKYEDSQKNQSENVTFSIPKAMNGEVTEIATPDAEKYGDVIHALTENTWYFNGGADTILDAITFTDSVATISQVYFDGNRKHENGVNDFAYTLDDTVITVTLEDGSPLSIPYTYEEGVLTLDTETYLTQEDIIAGLQGFWTVETSFLGRHIYYAHIEGNVITTENAASALNRAPGSYYWYGGDGYTGSFQLNFGGFDSEMQHAEDWFFNVINGKAVLLLFDSVCTPVNITKLPGQYGYSF